MDQMLGRGRLPGGKPLRRDPREKSQVVDQIVARCTEAETGALNLNLETIRIALTAAETGHLVLATLHTSDAPQTIDRLVDVFPPDQQQQIITQLAGVIEGIVCQRLIPSADGSGRVLASEVLRANHAIRTCIRERKLEQIVGLLEIGFREGNRTIDQSIGGLLETGQITREDALFNCRDRTLFEQPPESEKKKKSIWT